MRASALLLLCNFGLWLSCAEASGVAHADLILHHGRIVTVDSRFSVASAIAVTGNLITEVGNNRSVLKLKGPNTKVIDLEGRMVLPGLIDSHVHPDAAMTDFDHEVPPMETIQDVLEYVKARAAALPEGEWIQLRQVFITRLREQRYPTRDELDAAAPKHPVSFATGPDQMLNSLALKLAGIDRNFKVTDDGPGHVELDPLTGEPTGLLRGLGRFVKIKPFGKPPGEQDYIRRTLQLFKDYNSVGLTTVCDRNANPASIQRYQKLLDGGELPVRLMVSHGVATLGPLEEVQNRIRQVAEHPLRRGGPMLRIIGIKTFLDGGMLTGSAYMREPWGVSRIYGITDPNYRGVLNIPPDRLQPIVRTAVDAGLQFTAHAVGDGAVHTLLDIYEQIDRETPVRQTRPCITHSNFMSREDVERAARMGVVIDIQPAWLYLDARTLVNQFGYKRLRYFQPLRSIFAQGGIVGGGSDHMQKIDSLRATNPYNPFLGMWIAVTRRARWHEGRVHPEERLNREQAIRFYTRNNAHLLFLEDKVGSLEPGKLADFVVLDTDLLRCTEDTIKDAQVLQTYLDGRLVFERRLSN
jgi:predicted amidohydrolase YtcJ